MRLLTFNILDGGAGEPERLPRIAAWVRKQAVDVAGLVELNGMEGGGKFEAFVVACGFDHGWLMRSGASAYRVGVLSVEPVVCVAEVVDGFAHGAVHVRTGSLDVICTHFEPFDAERRIGEARRVVEMMGGVDGPAILMGDLNSHSPWDRTLCEMFATAENEVWAFDFRAQQVLLDAGLIDLGTDQPRRWTTATALNPGEPRRRLDYIYANVAFAQAHPSVWARAIHDDQSRRLSDHYPVVAAVWGDAGPTRPSSLV